MAPLTPEEHQIASALFHEVFDLDPEARAEVLRKRSLSPQVLAEVEHLLGEVEGDGFGDRELEAIPQRLMQGLGAEEDLPDSIGPYRIVAKIGAGGMGVVYRGEQASPQRAVAVKVLRLSGLGLADTRRFDREAELLGRLQHVGIAQIFESGTTSDGGVATRFIAMEYVDGKPLAEFVHGQQLDVRERVSLMIDLARAVHHAHLRGVLHRDLKPSNVMMTREGQVKVIDFGVGRPLEVDGEGSMATMTGQVIGTLAYMSPEQAGGEIGKIDARTDVYSLGVMAYELLAEQLPFATKNVPITEVVRTIREVQPSKLGTLAGECRGDLELIVAKAMAKEPERRYQSAAALADDFQRHLEFQPIEARPPSVAYQATRFARRHRAFVGGAIATLFAIIAGTVVAVTMAIRNGELADAERYERGRADQRTNEAQALTTELTRRADPGRLLMARQAASELWPPIPSKVREMDRWLKLYSEPLRTNLPRHKEYLAELRQSALPYGEEERLRDLETHPLAPDLKSVKKVQAGLRDGLAGTGKNGVQFTGEEARNAEELMEVNAVEIAKTEALVAQRHTWEFADLDQQDIHDTMAQLVVGLDEFFDPETGLDASVRARRERAMSLDEESRTSPIAAAAWKEAIADIKSREVYGGLELEPQLGLFPLRVDPDSGYWEFWHMLSGPRPLANEHPDRTSNWAMRRDVGIILVLVPGGVETLSTFGPAPDIPRQDRDAEFSPFFISKYEVTQAQWMQITGEQPSSYTRDFRFYGTPPADQPYHAGSWWNPVESISFEDTTQGLIRADLTLPTINQWNYAAGANAGTRYWTGSDSASLRGAANLADALVRTRGGPANWTYDEALDDGWSVHAPVGTFRANPMGLHDVHGNVWEWSRSGVESGFATCLGGSFEDGGIFSSFGVHNRLLLSSRLQNVGVRPIREIR